MLELTSGIKSVFTSVVACATESSVVVVVVVVVVGPVNEMTLLMPKPPKEDFACRKLVSNWNFREIRFEMICVLAGLIVGVA